MDGANLSHTNTGEVTLSGELTIFTIADHLAQLKLALDAHDEVRMRFVDITAVDLSGMQLLCSAHRTAAASGKVLSLSGAMPELLQHATRLAGFTRRKGCSFSPKTDCICWNGEESWES